MEPSKSPSPAKATDSTFNKTIGLRINKDTENPIPNADIINSHYNELNGCVMKLDKKVGEVLKQHEMECLKNYKEKMYAIQKEIRMLKDKANEEENNKRMELKLKELEHKRDQARERAEQLDKACKDQKWSLDKWKIRAEEIVDDKKFYEDQLIAAKKQQEHLKHQISSIETEKLHENDSLIETPLQISQKLSSVANSSSNNSIYFSQVTHRLKETIGHMYSQLEAERKNLRVLKNAKTNFLLEKGELEDLFLLCVEDVKREIYARKLKAGRNTNKTKKITEKDRQVEFNEFKEIDKRKVMEHFLNSEKVRFFLYEKMFGKIPEEPVTLERNQTGKSQRSLNKSRSSSKPSTSNGLLSHIFSKPHFSPETKLLHRPSSVPTELEKK
jgi:hypothetical protein